MYRFAVSFRPCVALVERSGQRITCWHHPGTSHVLTNFRFVGTSAQNLEDAVDTNEPPKAAEEPPALLPIAVKGAGVYGIIHAPIMCVQFFDLPILETQPVPNIMAILPILGPYFLYKSVVSNATGWSDSLKRIALFPAWALGGRLISFSLVTFIGGTVGYKWLQTHVVLSGEDQQKVYKMLALADDDETELGWSIQLNMWKAVFVYIAGVDDGGIVQVITREKLESYIEVDEEPEQFSVEHVKLLSEIFFSILDVDGSGGISFSEFAMGLALLRTATEGKASPDMMQEFTWRALDLDNNGFIERSELLVWVKMLLRVGGIRNEDLIITGIVNDYPATAEQITDRFMKEWDANQDGKVSRAEFDRVGQILDMSGVCAMLAEANLG